MGKYIRLRLREIQEELQLKLEEVNKEIEDFKKGLDVPVEEKSKRLEEMINGRLTPENLSKNYKLKLQYEQELIELHNYFYYNN